MNTNEVLKLALEALEHLQPTALTSFYTIGNRDKAIAALREALAKPDFWEGYVPEPVKPAQPVPDAFEQLMREADKPTQVPEGIAKYVDALMNGTHEITSVTIRPKRTWVGLTDEEITDMWAESSPYYHEDDFARAIEAKLRSKNEDRN